MSCVWLPNPSPSLGWRCSAALSVAVTWSRQCCHLSVLGFPREPLHQWLWRALCQRHVGNSVCDRMPEVPGKEWTTGGKDLQGAGVTRVSHATYFTRSNAPAAHGHAEHTLTAQLAPAYNNFCWERKTNHILKQQS